MNDILMELNSKEYIFQLNNLYDIGFCGIEEVDELVEFIDLYWKKNHIFVKDRTLLNWQHLNSDKNRYNFVIARSKKDKKIHAILGFVPTNQFDKEIEVLKVWPCIWKIKDGLEVRGLGVSLYYYLKENLDIEVMEMLGISEVALGIYKKWGFETGKINHYYLINRNMENYNILKNIPSELIKKEEMSGKIKISKIDRIGFETLENHVFDDKYKSKNYYINRFFNHPTYSYDCYMINSEDKDIGVFFTRSCYANDSKCIRIVDYLGNKNLFSYTHDFFENLIFENKAEYVDFVLVGWEENILLKAGFSNRDMSQIIIPNYFEPFEQRNVYLDYAHKSKNNGRVAFYKADADQDRPNL